MTPLYYLITYAAYLLGATVFMLDIIEKYQNIADANPNPTITYTKATFWRKERINLIKIFILGIISVIIVPFFFGGSSFQATNSEGHVIWQIPMKLAQIPVQITIGYTGGRAIIAMLGKSKGELYKKVGIDDK